MLGQNLAVVAIHVQEQQVERITKALELIRPETSGHGVIQLAQYRQ
jgi:hypothetical protein